jgi:hypothetical protein
MDALTKRLDIAKNLYQHLPAAEKERFGLRLTRLIKEVAECASLPEEERGPKIAALTRLVEDLDREMGLIAPPVLR